MVNNKDDFILELEKNIDNRKEKLAELVQECAKFEKAETKKRIIAFSIVSIVIILIFILFLLNIKFKMFLFIILSIFNALTPWSVKMFKDEVELSILQQRIHTFKEEIAGLMITRNNLLQNKQDACNLSELTNNLSPYGYNSYSKERQVSEPLINNQPTVFTNIKPKQYPEGNSLKKQKKLKIQKDKK